MKDDVILTLCYPDTDVKMNMLRDTINGMKGEYPIALATHLPVDRDIMDSVDYFIYEKEDAPSENYSIFYHFDVHDEVSIKTKRPIPYHALAGYISHKTAASFLRPRFTNLHYIQYDTSMRVHEYIRMAREKLESCKFVGSEYYVPGQNMHGLVGTYFSFNIRWFDNCMPEIHSWGDWEYYGRDRGNGLLGENWLHNYLTDNDLIKDCCFVPHDEMKKYLIGEKMQTRGAEEPGLKAYISELDDHRLILFVHLYADGKLPVFVDINGSRQKFDIPGGVMCWWVFDKGGYVEVSSKMQRFYFKIDPLQEYTDTVFRFTDNKLKCLKNF